MNDRADYELRQPLPFPSRRRSDAGMTLPEVLIAVTLIGLIMVVISSALIVTLRQHESTETRLNLSQSEQSVDLWLPADLSSAETVLAMGCIPGFDVDPNDGCTGRMTTQDDLKPCPGHPNATCGTGLADGSWALLASWSEMIDGQVDPPLFLYTNVGYYYSPDGESGETYNLSRVECTLTASQTENPTGAWTCISHVVVRNLPAPPPGWTPGDEAPYIDVDLPPLWNADGGTGSGTAANPFGNLQQVSVTLDDGSETGTQIKVTAGGVKRGDVKPLSSQNAPALRDAFSRCGGPMTILVDESSSIGTDVTTVRSAVRAFVSTLAGTPVRLQVITFGDRSRTLGGPGGLTPRYFDLSNEAHVAELIGPSGDAGLVSNIQIAGGGTTGTTSAYTNWESALFRTTHGPTGPAPLLPNTVVFFTDGLPTRDRTSTESSRNFRDESLNPIEPQADDSMGNYLGTEFSQEAWDRANYWADQIRGSLRMVGVLVGSSATGSSYQYQKASTWNLFKVADGDWTYHGRYRGRTNFVYERRVTQTVNENEHHARYWTRTSGTSTTWNLSTKSAYDGITQTNQQNRKANWFTRANSTSPWLPTYNTSWTTENSNRVRVTSNTVAQWPIISQTQYNNLADSQHGDTTTGRNDGFVRLTIQVSTETWDPISQATYNPSNSNHRKRVADTNNSTNPWRVISMAEYNANDTGDGNGNDGYEAASNANNRSGWYAITNNNWYSASAVDLYNHINVGGDNDFNDGVERRPVAAGAGVPVGAEEYAANNIPANDGTASDRNDGYWSTPNTGPGSGWVFISEAAYQAGNSPANNHSSEADGFRRISTSNSQLLGRLVGGANPLVVNSAAAAANRTAGLYLNTHGFPTDAQEVDAYAATWEELEPALRAIALGDCGGSLTVQTRHAGSTPGSVQYTNTQQYQSGPSGTRGGALPPGTWEAGTYKVTSIERPAQAFSFSTDTSKWIELVPSADGTMRQRYATDQWVCSRGTVLMTPGVDYEEFALDSPGQPVWNGVRVRIDANGAVSCIHHVVLA